MKLNIVKETEKAVIEYVDLEDCEDDDDVASIIDNAIDFDDLNNL